MIDPDTLTPEQRLARGRLWRPELDGAPVAIVEELLGYLARWTIPLSPALLVVPSRPGETGLLLTLRDLLSYARTGQAGDWEGSAEARDALLELSALYQPPLDDGATVPADWVAGSTTPDDSPRGLLTEIARAAWARVHLADGAPVPRAWLAALAGVSPPLVREAIASGQLVCVEARERDGGRAPLDVTADSAALWLRARGVVGL